MKSVLYLGCPSVERADTEKILATANVSVVWADTVAFALNELQRREMPVLLDLSRGAAALQLARELRTERSSTLMFAVVDARRPDLTTEAVLAGMADVFARPLGGRRVASAIDRELAYDVPESAPSGDSGAGDTLYSQSPAMGEVMALIARAATMRAGVTIRGEQGTGRRIAARAIHDGLPPRSKAAFVTVDCRTYEAEQLDAELFGVASRSHHDELVRGLVRVGRQSRLFEAQNGTLYLQHVADASTRVQARLARVLRDREAVLTESGEAIVLDVRPMAGADPSFDTAVQEGRIREDLARRLSVIRIDMPPLRSRREDIPALANYILRDICGSLRIPPKTLSRPALSLIAALPWRGNAVELRSLLESVVAGLRGGRGIGLEDVLAHLRLDGGSIGYATGGTLRQARARFEREYILAALELHHGRISEAARALGIQGTNLYRKLRSLRVTRERRG